MSAAYIHPQIVIVDAMTEINEAALAVHIHPQIVMTTIGEL